MIKNTNEKQLPETLIQCEFAQDMPDEPTKYLVWESKGGGGYIPLTPKFLQSEL